MCGFYFFVLLRFGTDHLDLHEFVHQSAVSDVSSLLRLLVLTRFDVKLRSQVAEIARPDSGSGVMTNSSCFEDPAPALRWSVFAC